MNRILYGNLCVASRKAGSAPMITKRQQFREAPHGGVAGAVVAGRAANVCLLLNNWRPRRVCGRECPDIHSDMRRGSGRQIEELAISGVGAAEEFVILAGVVDGLRAGSRQLAAGTVGGLDHAHAECVGVNSITSGGG